MYGYRIALLNEGNIIWICWNLPTHLRYQNVFWDLYQITILFKANRGKVDNVIILLKIWSVRFQTHLHSCRFWNNLHIAPCINCNYSTLIEFASLFSLHCHITPSTLSSESLCFFGNACIKCCNSHSFDCPPQVLLMPHAKFFRLFKFF